MRAFWFVSAFAAMVIPSVGRPCTSPTEDAGQQDPPAVEPPPCTGVACNPGALTLAAIQAGNEFIVTWTPGVDVDADPNQSIYWMHSGHTIWTRVTISDAITDNVVRDSLVKQFDADVGNQGDTFDAIHSTREGALPAGDYKVQVQSVYDRHDTVKVGINDTWGSPDKLTNLPPVPDSTATTYFTVVPATAIDGTSSPGELAAEAACTSFGTSPLLLTALIPLLRRRR